MRPSALSRLVALAAVAAAVAAGCGDGPDPVRVKLYGDSLVYDSAKYWGDLMAESGRFEARQTGYPGTNTCDAFEQMEEDRDEFRPDIVAIAFGGNDSTPCMRHEDGSKLTRQEFLAKFRADTEQALEIVGDDVTVYLFAPPAMPDGQEAELHDIYREIAAGRDRVRYRDAGRLVSPDRTWVETLPCLPDEIEGEGGKECSGPVVDGVPSNVVRAWDGVHFCPVNPGWGKPCAVYASGAYRFVLALYEDIRDGGT